jgi:hypothetical protein
MIHRDGAPAEAHDEARPAGNEKGQAGEDQSWRKLKPVEPAQFRIPNQIADRGQIGLVMSARENPAEMRIDEASTARGMNVVLGIGVKVMVAMFGCPPQNAFLSGRL